MSNVVRGNARRLFIGASVWIVGFVAFEPREAVFGDEPAEPPKIVRVEEDWVLEVGIPDADNTAPQITCVFAPTADVDFAYAEFAVNHHSLPSFVPGGLQLLVWSGGTPIVS